MSIGPSRCTLTVASNCAPRLRTRGRARRTLQRSLFGSDAASLGARHCWMVPAAADRLRLFRQLPEERRPGRCTQVDGDAQDRAELTGAADGRCGRNWVIRFTADATLLQRPPVAFGLVR